MKKPEIKRTFDSINQLLNNLKKMDIDIIKANGTLINITGILEDQLELIKYIKYISPKHPKICCPKCKKLFTYTPRTAFHQVEIIGITTLKLEHYNQLIVKCDSCNYKRTFNDFCEFNIDTITTFLEKRLPESVVVQADKLPKG